MLLRPLEMKIANVIARGVIERVNDATKLQSVQFGALDDETIDDGERFQEYGFTSVPLAGSEAVIVFPDGDRGHPLVVAVDDRAQRLTGLDPGEVAVYSESGARIVLKASGDIEVEPGSGGKMLVRTSGGVTDALVTKTEFMAHIHVGGGGNTTPPTVTITGTTDLEAQ